MLKMSDFRPVEQMSFNEAMQELNEIVAKLESNRLELEDALVYYERGVAVLAYVRRNLTEAQQKVDMLMGNLELLNEEDLEQGLHKA